MEPSKANTVGIVKNSPSLRPRKTLQFFRACSGEFFFPQNGKDNKPGIIGDELLLNFGAKFQR